MCVVVVAMGNYMRNLANEPQFIDKRYQRDADLSLAQQLVAYRWAYRRRRKCSRIDQDTGECVTSSALPSWGAPSGMRYNLIEIERNRMSNGN